MHSATRLTAIDDHLGLANRNQAALEVLAAHSPLPGEWVTTVAFYKALQVVEAVFAARSERPPSSHGDRNARLKKPPYSAIWKHYRPLWNASCVARYLAEHDAPAKVYRSFYDYIPEARVESLVIRHLLHQVEESACRMLSGRGTLTLARAVRKK